MEANCGETAVEEAQMDPCGICGKRVMQHCLRCTCRKWVHARYARVKATNRMTERCLRKKCSGISNGSGEVEEQETMYMNNQKMDYFCYLNDMINSGGGCEIAVARKCRYGWMKFNKLASVLRDRRVTMEMKMCKTCV